MQKFLHQLSLFLSLIVALCLLSLLYLWLQDKNLNYAPGETDSALLSIPSNTSVDIVIMGSSHARMFSRNSNHTFIENRLNKKIVNIGISAAGIIPEHIILSYFYAKKNYTPVILYVIDPFVFSTPTWNENLYFLSDEPFRLDFLPTLLASPVNFEVKHQYILSKFSKKWRKEQGKLDLNTQEALTTKDSDKITQRLQTIYPDKDSLIHFKRYEKELYAVINTAKKHHAQLIFLIPPTLLGNQPLTGEIINTLKQIHNTLGYPYYDLSQAIPNPAYYHNHDHLNNAGIAHLLQHYSYVFTP